jgi:hypothetical protein
MGKDTDYIAAFMKDNSTLAKLRVQGNEYEFMVDDGELFSV